MQRTVSQASESDLPFLLDLQKRFSNQIGFLPKSAFSDFCRQGMILRGDLNDHEAGYFLVRKITSLYPDAVSIVQAAVRLDAQRHSLGLSLVESAKSKALAEGGLILQASCREDLESNLFWYSAGFTPIAFRKGGAARGQRIILWRLALSAHAILSKIEDPLLNLGPNGRFCSKHSTGGWIHADAQTFERYSFNRS